MLGFLAACALLGYVLNAFFVMLWGLLRLVAVGR